MTQKFNPLDAPRDFSPSVWLAGVGSATIMSAYSLLAYWFGSVLRVHQVVFLGVDFDWIFAIGFFALGAWTLLSRPKSPRAVATTLILHYIATAIFAILISYDQAVLHVLWLLLFVATGLIAGWIFLIAGEVFMVATTIFALLLPGANPSLGTLIDNVIAALAIIAIADFTLHLGQTGVVKLGVYNDLKSREQEQADRLSAIINSMNEAVLNTDVAGAVELYNAAALSLLDTNKNLAGDAIDELFHLVDGDGKPVTFAELLPAVARDTEREDLSHVFADGEKIDLSLAIAPVRDEGGGKDRIRGYVIIARDITKQKSLEDQKDEFISVVSHELRTPVAIAEGSLSNLQLLISRGGDPKLFASTLDAAHKSVLFLGQMVNDLSTLSRAQRGVMMEPEDIDLREFAEETLAKYSPEAETRALDFVVDCRLDGTVRISRMALGEIIQNFVTNALKYTKKGGVTFTIRPAKNPENSSQKLVEFAVADTGIGISTSDQKHVYERFWRSEDYRTRETSGTGLGLHVVEELTRQLGIKIALKSRLNRGSTFSFTLPLAENADAAPEKNVPENSAPKKA